MTESAQWGRLSEKYYKNLVSDLLIKRLGVALEYAKDLKPIHIFGTILKKKNPLKLPTVKIGHTSKNLRQHFDGLFFS